MTTETWIVSDGVKIVGDVAGDISGPGVVLLHGGGQTRHSWSRAFRAITEAGFFALRGHGDSGWSTTGDYSFGRLAQDLETIIAGVTGPVALVGASMGGLTAIQAIASGLRPGALVLVDIVLRPEPKGIDRIKKFMAGNLSGFASLDEAVTAVASYNPHRPRPKDSAGILKNLRLRSDGRWYWHWDPRLIIQREPEDSFEPDVEQGLRAAVGVPVLLIQAAESDVVSDRSIIEFRNIVPTLEVVKVEKAGHMVSGDANDAFNSAMLEFVRRHLRS